MCGLLSLCSSTRDLWSLCLCSTGDCTFRCIYGPPQYTVCPAVYIPPLGRGGGGGGVGWEEGAGGTSYCVYVSPLETSCFGGMESGPMLTPRETSPSPENLSSEEDRTHHAASSRKDSEPNTLTTNELSQPREVSDESCCLALYQHTDTGPASPRADPTTPGTEQGRQYGTNL